MNTIINENEEYEVENEEYEVENEEYEVENEVDEVENEVDEVEKNTLLFKFYEQHITTKAIAICNSYNSGNGKFNPSDLPDVAWDKHVTWLLALGLYTASKMDRTDLYELASTKSVSKKHSLLLAKSSTGRYDFTSLLKACTFISKIDNVKQEFTFRRESRSIIIDLDLLEDELDKIGLQLITEETATRSGAVIVQYFYDIK